MAKSNDLLVSVAVSTIRGSVINNNYDDDFYYIIDQSDTPASIRDTKKYHFMNHKGLSRSRNYAMDLCDSDILLFSDDDVVHYPDAIHQIRNEFEKTGADIITFPGKPF